MKLSFVVPQNAWHVLQVINLTYSLQDTTHFRSWQRKLDSCTCNLFALGKSNKNKIYISIYIEIYQDLFNLYTLILCHIFIRLKLAMSTNNRTSGESNIAETLAAAFGRPQGPQHSYKTMTSWSQTNFGIITKIVKWLRERHLNGDSEPLTLNEILDETEQIDISSRTRAWLENEVLEANPRIRVIKPEEGSEEKTKYQYKPLIDVKDRKTLRKFLMERYQSGEGAIMMDDILESLPNANRAIKWLVDNEHIVVITRPNDKQKIVFYNEGKQDIKVDKEFVELWRSLPVDALSDDKIEEYLEKHGIQSIQDLASKKMEPVQKRRKVMRRPNKNFKAHNEHMKDILQDYATQ